MNILKFVQKLLPTFKRSKLEVDIRRLQELLKKSVLPSIKKAIDVTRGQPLSTPLAAQYEQGIRKASGISSNVHTTLQILYNMYVSLQPKLDYIEKIVDEEFETDLARENMTYKQVTIVQFLGLAKFSMEYGMRLVTRLLAAEARARLNQAERIDDQLTANELEWFASNTQAFMQVVGLLHIPPLQLRQALEQMPEVIVQPEKSDIVHQTVGVDKLDPLRLNFINASAMTLNPIYHIRLMKAELETQAYKNLELEAQVVELRLLELKQAYEDRQDPRLQEQIEYNESRLSRLRVEYNQQTLQYGL